MKYTKRRDLCIQAINKYLSQFWGGKVIDPKKLTKEDVEEYWKLVNKKREVTDKISILSVGDPQHEKLSRLREELRSVESEIYTFFYRKLP